MEVETIIANARAKLGVRFADEDLCD